MNFLNQKLSSLNVVLGTIKGQKTLDLSRNSLIDEKSSILNLVGYLTALLLTLPAITTLLLLWFQVR